MFVGFLLFALGCKAFSMCTESCTFVEGVCVDLCAPCTYSVCEKVNKETVPVRAELATWNRPAEVRRRAIRADGSVSPPPSLGLYL